MGPADGVAVVLRAIREQRTNLVPLPEAPSKPLITTSRRFLLSPPRPGRGLLDGQEEEKRGKVAATNWRTVATLATRSKTSPTGTGPRRLLSSP